MPKQAENNRKQRIEFELSRQDAVQFKSSIKMK